MDKIEILDRDKKTKAVYRLDKEEHLEGYQEEREYNSWLEVVISSIFKVLRFNLYLIMSFLKILIKVIESLFLKDYEPLKPILDKQREIQDKKAKDYIIRNTDMILKEQYLNNTVVRAFYNFMKDVNLEF